MAATKKVQDKPGAQARPRPASVKGAPGTVTSASSWKKQSVEGTLITVPSGNTALVRAPGMQVFLTEGVIPNGLMSLVQEAMVSGQAPKGLDESEFLKDPATLQQIIDLADAVTVYCCIDPKVQPAPRDEEGNVLPFGDESRDIDTLFVDEVDFMDKMFIFNFAVGGGTADLEKFRTQSFTDVVDVQPGEDLVNPTL